MSQYDWVPGRAKRVLVVSLAISACALFSGNVWAKGGGGHGGGGERGEFETHGESGGHGGGGGHHSGEDGEVHRGGRGSIVRDLPNGSSKVVVRGNPFFFHEGRFFSRHRDGFIIVQAPIGAIVTTLPLGVVSLSVGGINYFAGEDTYYQRIPEGFIVVDSPHR